MSDKRKIHVVIHYEATIEIGIDTEDDVATATVEESIADDPTSFLDAVGRSDLIVTVKTI